MSNLGLSKPSRIQTCKPAPEKAASFCSAQDPPPGSPCCNHATCSPLKPQQARWVSVLLKRASAETAVTADRDRPNASKGGKHESRQEPCHRQKVVSGRISIGPGCICAYLVRIVSSKRVERERERERAREDESKRERDEKKKERKKENGLVFPRLTDAG